MGLEIREPFLPQHMYEKFFHLCYVGSIIKIYLRRFQVLRHIRLLKQRHQSLQKNYQRRNK